MGSAEPQKVHGTCSIKYPENSSIAHTQPPSKQTLFSQDCFSVVNILPFVFKKRGLCLYIYIYISILYIYIYIYRHTHIHTYI